MDNLPGRQVFPPAFRTVPFALTAASLGALATALVAQHAGGLQPCALCLVQRWPYAAAVALGIGTRLTTSRRAEGWLLAAMALAFLFGAAAAALHVGMEQHWWVEAGACQSLRLPGVPLPAAPLPRCDRPAWSLLGASMASYNGAFSSLLALLALRGALARLDTAAPRAITGQPRPRGTATPPTATAPSAPVVERILP